MTGDQQRPGQFTLFQSDNKPNIFHPGSQSTHQFSLASRRHDADTGGGDQETKTHTTHSHSCASMKIILVDIFDNIFSQDGYILRQSCGHRPNNVGLSVCMCINIMAESLVPCSSGGRVCSFCLIISAAIVHLMSASARIKESEYPGYYSDCQSTF